AFLHEPAIMLMDEPLRALDGLTREERKVGLSNIKRATCTTVLFGTHYVAEAVYLANRVVVMSPRHGRIVEILDVNLPDDRDYAETMEDAAFHRVANRVRDLLGTNTAQE